MGETIRFWRRCAAHALKGTVAFANNWSWFFGVPPVAAMLQFIASGSGASMTGSAYLDALVTGFFAFVVTWFAIFAIRLIKAPADLYKLAGAEITSEPTKLARPLPISLSVESVGSYMRTSERVDRLDKAIAKMARTHIRPGETLAYGMFKELKTLGVANIAELDALL